MVVYKRLGDDCFFPDTDAALQDEYPEIAIKLLRNIALEISERLRIRTNEVRVLEEG